MLCYAMLCYAMLSGAILGPSMASQRGNTYRYRRYRRCGSQAWVAAPTQRGRSKGYLYTVCIYTYRYPFTHTVAQNQGSPHTPGQSTPVSIQPPARKPGLSFECSTACEFAEPTCLPAFLPFTPAINEGCTRSLRISHSMYCIVPTTCVFYTGSLHSLSAA
jgi:hypothetical protein